MKPDAPGWYPDPADETRMRRWDGGQWTGESRERPPWAPASGVPAVTERKKPAWHWKVFGAVAVLLFGAISYKALTAPANLPDRTIFDPEFIAAANDTCRDEITALHNERPRPGSREAKEPGTLEQVAAKVDSVADRLQGVADRLRRLPVLPEDKADVDGWLADWDRYTELGHDYAGAVRDDSSRQGDIAEEGVGVGRRATLFADANKLDACMFI